MPAQNLMLTCNVYYCYAYPYPCSQYVGFAGYTQYEKAIFFFLLFIFVLCYIYKNSFVNYQTTNNCEKFFIISGIMYRQ